VVAAVGEASARDEADVAGSDHADSHRPGILKGGAGAVKESCPVGCAENAEDSTGSGGGGIVAGVTAVRSAMVLCAGLGTRLRPLTDVVPKPLVPIAGVPLVVRTLRQLRAAGVERVVVNTFHLAERVREALGSGEALGLTIDVRVEGPEILGTGGGVKGVLDFFERDEAFLLVNGDVVIDADFGAVAAAHLGSRAAATMLVREVPDADRWGAVEIDRDGWVRRLLGEGEGRGAELTATMFTGVHVIDPRRVGPLLPAQGCIVRSAYLALVPRGEVFAVRHTGRFFDVGTPGRYLDANLAIAGTRAVVDPSARVAAGVRLDRVVVWAGADVTEDERDAVVTSFGVVRDTDADRSRG
jgi:NDP-sugar pyrophosphorylase family protein